MQNFLLLCLVVFSFAVAQIAPCDDENLTEDACKELIPNCYFNYNRQACDFEYSSGMDFEMCAHGFPGSYWDDNEKVQACVTDPCIYWNVFDDDTAPCNSTFCEWRQYHNVKFVETGGKPTYIESYQCLRKSLVRDNPCYMLGPTLFIPTNEYYCEHFDECEITVIYDPVGQYSYENCDLKENDDCGDVGVDQCSDESPTCFVSGEQCVLDRCLREKNCPKGCVKKPFHDMTFVDEKPYYAEITQCVNSSASDYNQCYLVKPSYCDHYEDCEEKIAPHGSHGHLICSAKKTTGRTTVVKVSVMVKLIIFVVLIFLTGSCHQ